MRYIMRERILSWGDDFTIKDADGRNAYYVDGKVFSFGDKLSFNDMEGNELARIEQKLLSIGPQYEIAVIRETLDPGWSRGLARRWGLVAAGVMLLALVTAAPMVDALEGRTLTLAVLSAPLVRLAVLPPAIFLMFAWRPVSRAVPTAGTACCLAVVVLALADGSSRSRAMCSTTFSARHWMPRSVRTILRRCRAARPCWR